MKCVLKQTKAGHKLVERSTGRLYGYLRGEGTTEKKQAANLAARVKGIQKEIAGNGHYDTERARV